MRMMVNCARHCEIPTEFRMKRCVLLLTVLLGECVFESDVEYRVCLTETGRRQSPQLRQNALRRHDQEAQRHQLAQRVVPAGVLCPGDCRLDG